MGMSCQERALNKEEKLSNRPCVAFIMGDIVVFKLKTSE